jgi:hypothetical protein
MREHYNFKCINAGCKNDSMTKADKTRHFECPECIDKFSKKMISLSKETPKKGDITGKWFGNVQAIEHIKDLGDTNSVWLFKCVCGTKITASRSGLYSNPFRHCGCIKDSSGKPIKGILRNIKSVA